MCEPINSGVCNCPPPRITCACGVCQKCGRRIPELFIKPKEDQSNEDEEDL